MRMKFLSIKEYFYKLNTIGFILLLLPLGVFIFLHFRALENAPMMPDLETETTLLTIAIIIFFIDLTIVHLWWRIRLRRLETLLELAKKMDGYYSLTLLKMAVYCSFSLLSALGFFLTGSDWFTGLFILTSALLILQWPTPSAFCRYFTLRNDEREMILNGTDVKK
jgi:hypothetical protein